MTLHVVYATTRTTFVDISAHVQFQDLTLEQSAEEAATGSCTLIVDDDNDALDFLPHHPVWFWESSESALNQIIGVWYIGDISVSDGPAVGLDGEYVQSSGRRWTLSLDDENVLLTRRLITGADGNRPAENDVDRINWVTTSAYSDHVGNSASFVSGSGPVAMDAADLRGQTAYDVYSDCADRSGKNYYAFYNPNTDTSPPTYLGTTAIWYDLATASNYSSGKRLSNVLSDIDGTTTYGILPGATLSRSGQRIWSGALVTGTFGSDYEQNTATGNLYAYRDVAVSNSNVKTVAKAAALGTRYLTDNASYDDRITCSINVSRDKVNKIRKGQLVSFFNGRMPGYNSAFVNARVLRRTVTHLPNDYRIDFVLAPTQAAADPTIFTWTISTTGDTAAVSSQHFTLAAGTYYARATFTTGQPGDSAPKAWLDGNSGAATGGIGSVMMEIAYNQSPYGGGSSVLPAPGGFSYDFSFTNPPLGYPDYQWTGGTQYFHASMSSFGHTANAQSMTLLVSAVPLP